MKRMAIEDIVAALEMLDDEEPVILEHAGKPRAALITLSDLRHFQETERTLESLAAEEAYREFVEGGEEAVPWEPAA